MSDGLFPYGEEQESGIPGPQLDVGLRFSGDPLWRIGIVDTGASCTGMPEKWLTDVGALCTYKPSKKRPGNIRVASGKLEHFSLYFLEIHFGVLGWYWLEVVAIDQRNYALIGRDILRRCAIELDGVNRTMKIWKPTRTVAAQVD